ncbi:hypothetical protein EIB71_02735 [Kaistella daneshvariae]|uniref:Uncharacterized protein n=1 Tax=Kaistella daneshvariae TaxID=2487074 RepID=A0ABM7C6R2_9FLAO|nr:hypothetical protein [Kaistella daneshvariae]AZI66662.1 hypothetical protein EIB71_02735 [Kaistella daneshvariae]
MPVLTAYFSSFPPSSNLQIRVVAIGMEVEIPDPEYSGEELQRTARLFFAKAMQGKKRLPEKIPPFLA